MVGFVSKVFCHERQPPILWKSRSRTGEEVQLRTRVVALCWWCSWPLGACVLTSPSPFHSLAGTSATPRRVIFQLPFVVLWTTRLLPFSFLLFVWFVRPRQPKGSTEGKHPPTFNVWSPSPPTTTTLLRLRTPGRCTFNTPPPLHCKKEGSPQAPHVQRPLILCNY